MKQTRKLKKTDSIFIEGFCREKFSKKFSSPQLVRTSLIFIRSIVSSDLFPFECVVILMQLATCLVYYEVRLFYVLFTSENLEATI